MLTPEEIAHHAETLYKMAHMFLEGRTNEGENFSSGLGLLAKAASKGHLQAQKELAIVFRNGMYGMDRDRKQFEYWCNKAIKQGDCDSIVLLANSYFFDCRGFEVDFKKAFELYRAAAELNGNADAEKALGDCYWLGLGVPSDEAKALFWYKMAAAKGHKQAVAALKLRGHYDPDELMFLVEIFGKEDEDVLAQYERQLKNAQDLDTGELVRIGHELLISRGKKCTAEGVKCLEIAAFRDDPYAQCLLGDVYAANSFCVEPDYEMAVYWYQEAAKQNHPAAWLRISYSYSSGYGVEKDLKKAFEYAQKAAETGLREAQYALGCMYEKGEGVEADLDQAIKWYTKAANQYEMNAQDALKRLLG